MKDRVVFVAKFAAVMIGLYVVVALNPVNDHLIIPFTEVIARCSAVVLRMWESGVEVVGTVIRSPRFALDVRNGCNGIEAAILLVAAIFAFPATLRSRLIGIAVAIVGIELVNIVRLVCLVWLGEHYRAVFDFFHVGVWQMLVILAAISMFVLWSLKFAEKRLVESR